MKQNKKEVAKMFNEKTQKHIDKAVKAELKTALEQGVFADFHHAYAILKEELEEVNSDMKTLNLYFDRFWGLVKGDYDKTRYEYRLESMQYRANEAIKELCQVIAVIKKTQRQLLNEETQNESNGTEH